MIQIEFNKKLFELEERISLFTRMLQHDVEDQCFELNLEEGEDTDEEFVEELMDCVESSYQYEEEEGKIRVPEHEEKVHITCEPEQGVYLGEGDGDANERFVEDLKDRSA